MKLQSIQVEGFKRFTDLKVQGIPASARLIILAGPNGCGKSSFFDALIAWRVREALQKQRGWGGFQWDSEYHDKANTRQKGDWMSRISLSLFGSIPNEPRKAIYIRSAYRNDPEFQMTSLSRLEDPFEHLRVPRMINNDAAVSKNFQRLVSQSVEELFAPTDGSITLDEYAEQILGDIRNALSKLFTELKLDSLGNPLVDGTFRFTKGISAGFSFKNLSGGEKAVFDLILDLVVASSSYDDTIFCIDEPEAHMNARLQADLLSVLYDLVPENCQLILATHSIGMMRRARDIDKENPGSVVFLDFGDRDFDQPQVIEPTIPDRTFWKKAHHVALDDLAALIAPNRVIICEGEPKNRKTMKNHSHDARCYERIFEAEFPETQFLPGGNSKEVAEDRRGIAFAFGHLTEGVEVIKLVDGDDLSPEEVDEQTKEGVRVLTRRNLESYLFDDEVLKSLAQSEEKYAELAAKKQDILAARTNDPADDLKPASGELYIACKDQLSLVKCGNNAKTFMRDTLAPLVKPDMAVYQELKHDIFGKEHGS